MIPMGEGRIPEENAFADARPYHPSALMPYDMASKLFIDGRHGDIRGHRQPQRPRHWTPQTGERDAVITQSRRTHGQPGVQTADQQQQGEAKTNGTSKQGRIN
jgi:hypothetical protein